MPKMNAVEALEAKDNGTVLPDLKTAAMLGCRVRGAPVNAHSVNDDALGNALLLLPPAGRHFRSPRDPEKRV